MASEITFIVEYHCPRCEAALEARSSLAYGWLRCPRCGCASLPPDHMRSPQPWSRPPSLGDEILLIGPGRPGGSRTSRSSFPPGSFRRIAGASALFLSLLIALLSLLEHERVTATVFIVIALICLGFSVYPARPS